MMRVRFLYRSMLALTGAMLLSAQAEFFPIISEFMASNDETLKDEDGSSSDWIEIFNAGTSGGNLKGWCLTDSSDDLAQWVFPDTPMPAGSYLLVFASGKDRRFSERELHTNFKLGGGGEYLALVRPDRVSVVSEYAPEYPDQLTDVSYGLTMASERYTLSSSGAPAEILIPSSDALGADWTQTNFSPGAEWTNGSASVGFDVGTTSVPGLVAHWPLDETTGHSAVDLSGLGNHGNLNGSTFDAGSVSGAFGNALQFDGVDDSVTMGTGPSLSGQTDFSVSAWIKTTASADQVIIQQRDSDGYDGEYILNVNTDGSLRFMVFGNGAYQFDFSTTAVVNDGQWHFVAAVRDGRNGYIYVDGVSTPAASGNGPVRDLDAAIGVAVGRDIRDNRWAFDGLIDDVAVFDRSLGTAEMQQIMESSLPESGEVDYGAIFSTDLESSMHGINSSAYLRIPFLVDNTDDLASMTLRMKYDDGFSAYLNGTQVAAYNAPVPLRHDSSATDRNPDAGAILFEEFNVSGFMNSLQAGTNILSIHALNFDVLNEDFLIVPELTASTAPLIDPALAGYFASPTPGKENAVSTDIIGPIVSDTGHLPLEPLLTESLVVTANVAQAFHPVASVTLHYRAMYDAEASLAMLDNGIGPDVYAGDGIYSAVIPAGTAASGEMLRYYISATDSQSNAMRVPRITDTEGSAQSPEYYGTRIQDPSVTSLLPIFYWWTRDASASHTRAGTRCSVFYNGEFYDNVFVRQRGGYVNLSSQKFVFDKSHRFRASDTLGRVREINMNAQGSDASFIRQTLAFQLFAESGMPACESFLTLMQLNGTTDRVGVLIEQVDDEFLDRHELDEFSTLYKGVQIMDFSTPYTPGLSQQPDGIEKKIPSGDTDFSDLQELINGLTPSHSAAERRAFLFDNFNVPDVISYLAVRAIIQDTDDVRKNFYICRDTHGTGEWRLFPWDKDYSFGVAAGDTYASHPFYGDYDHRKNDGQWSWLLELFYNDDQSEIRDMLRRRMRTLMDAYLMPPGTPSGTAWLDRRAAALFAPADPHPGPSTSAYNGVISFLESKRTNLYVTHHESNLPADVVGIPDAQPADTTIRFGAYEKSPASGNQDEEYIELTNTNSIAVDISGWAIRGGIEFDFAAGTVIPAGQSLYLSPSVTAFRQRSSGPGGGQGLFVVGGYKGHLSDLGEHLVLCNAEKQIVDELLYSGSPSVEQEALRITEIMYAPRLPLSGSTPGRDFEYIELKNTGVTAVDLTGIHFSEGIEFTFSEGVLQPDGIAVIARTPAAFAARYNTNGLFLAGPYCGSLDNAGEQIVLKDALEQTIASFAYGSGRGWPLSAAGAGHALVPVIDGGIQGETLDYTGNWRAGTYRDGSPGYDDPAPFTDLLINEITAHTDLSDPAYPEYDSNDWIELFNPTPSDESLHNWYLSDDADDLKKWAVPSVITLSGGEWVVFDEINGFHSPITSGFGLNKAGEQVFLSYLPGSGADRVADAVRFAGQENGRSYSRFADGQPQWFDTEPTPGAANRRNTPTVVIRRVMYNPKPLSGRCESNTEHEYVEVYNITGSPVQLWNGVGGWRISGTIDFTVPPGTSLAAHEGLIIVPFDSSTNLLARTAFLDAHGMTEGVVELAGPFAGSLGNRGGRISLEKPQAPDLPGDPISWITVDEMIYFDSAPWAEGADGSGLPITRIQADQSGSDPQNWRASETVPSMVDLDLDGLPDLWETTWFGGIHISPYAYSDSDPFSNADEYIAGTDPTNSASYFYVEVDQTGASPCVQFTARAATGPGYEGLQRLYTLESTTGSVTSVWQSVSGYTDIYGLDQTVVYDALTNDVEFFKANVRLVE